MRSSKSFGPTSSTKVQLRMLLGLGCAVLVACGRPDGAAGGPPGAGANAAAARPSTAAMTVTTAAVRTESITRSVPATGSIHPWQEVVIGPEVGGYRVSEVLVDVGRPVRRGQVLVRLSADLLASEVGSRRASLRSAEADAANAAAALKRGQTISTSGALSAADLDKLNADSVASQARVETARADLHNAELRLRYTNVTAPDDGTISSRTVSVGQIAQAGNEMLRLLRQNRVEWRAEVPEALLAGIRAGQTAEITGVDGSRIEGKVRAVAPTVSVTNRTAIVYVDIEKGAARPGTFARGAISVGKGDALLVPVQSVVMQDGYSYVFVTKDEQAVERRLVQPINVRGNDMEIASGVAVGEVIAVQGAGFLKDRDSIRVVRAEAGTAPAPTTVSSTSGSAK
jgi:RND family efflux transporter MFP subunit